MSDGIRFESYVPQINLKTVKFDFLSEERYIPNRKKTNDDRIPVIALKDK